MLYFLINCQLLRGQRNVEKEGERVRNIYLELNIHLEGGNKIRISKKLGEKLYFISFEQITRGAHRKASENQNMRAISQRI